MNENNFNNFTAIQLDRLENNVDNLFPHDENLRKRGRFGKFVADNRWAVVKATVATVVLLFVIFGGFLFQASLNLGAAAANGLIGRAPMMMPWTREDIVHEAILQSMARNVATNGGTVHNVVEPLEKVSDLTHYALLVRGVDRNNTSGALTAQTLAPGYLPWKAFWSDLNANFTLQHANRLVRTNIAKEKNSSDCVCYVEYGLPHNIVYLTSSNEILYGPVVKSASSEKIKVRTKCSFKTLAENFIEANKKKYYVSRYTVVEKNESESDWEEVSKSGAIDFVDADLQTRTKIFGLPQFPCIQHCIALYSMLLEPLPNEIKL